MTEKTKYFNKGNMEEIKVGDLVRFKGSAENDPSLLVTEVSENNYSGTTASLLHIDSSGSPEKTWRVPVICLTKINKKNIKYVPSLDRDHESIVVGDVVSLKNYPNIKMVVKDVTATGNEITAMWFNDTKKKVEDISSIGKICFLVHEMIVLSTEEENSKKD